MSAHQVAMVRKWVVGQTALIVLLIAYTVLSSYSARQTIVDAIRKDCLRSTGDRLDNAGGWLDQARSDWKIANDPFQSAATRAARGESAAQNFARAARERARIVSCTRAVPLPAPLTLRLGLGVAALADAATVLQEVPDQH